MFDFKTNQVIIHVRVQYPKLFNRNGETMMTSPENIKVNIDAACQ